MSSSATLLREIDQENIEGILSLLQSGANINAISYGTTPLLRAILNRANLSFVQILLHHGADPNKSSNSGETALIAAAHLGYSHLIEVLLQHKADANLQDKHGRTVLHYASMFCSDCIRILSQTNTDFNCIDYKGETALDLAYKGKFHQCTHNLIKYGADPYKTKVASKHSGKSALYWMQFQAPTLTAVEIGDNKMLDDFLKQGVATDTRKGDDSHLPLLIIAVEHNNVEAIEVLLKYGADVNITSGPGGWSALTKASSIGQLQAVKALLKNGADMNYKMKNGRDSLSCAAFFGYDEIVKELQYYSEHQKTC